MQNLAINVAAAVVVHQDRVLLARRRGGYLDRLWEFPGGKLEKTETAAEAARRELIEELDIRVCPGQTLLVLEHAYPDKTVRLHFVACSLGTTAKNSLATTAKNPETAWFKLEELPLADFCPADRIAADRLPWKQILNNEESNE